MKQTQALDILKAGRNVYLTGPAGSGKTHVLREYISYLQHREVVAGLTASTGIAATHFGGVTIHSWSGIGIKEELSTEDIDELVQKAYLWKRFDKTKVLIIDEISMLQPGMFDSLERLCRAMKQNEKPFGGMQVVLSGDFFQLPPVVRGDTTVQFITSSYAWRDMDIRVCYLHEQYRQEDDVLFNILNEIRGGSVTKKSRVLLEDQQGRTFPPGITPTRLYTHNKDVDVLNETELSKLSGEAYEYDMETKGKANLVTALKKGVLAPECLVLKRGAVVMFVKNNFESGYVNGTLGVVEDFNNDVPAVRTFSGGVIDVEQVEWTIRDGEKVMALVKQLPLRLAWAITVHKSQGMNLDAAQIDLSKSFVAGQGYVALSRLRTLSGLVLQGINEMALSVNEDILQLDGKLRSLSSKWEKVIARFSHAQMEAMHRGFIEKSDGITDEAEIKKNEKKKRSGVEEKIPSHEKTKALIEKGLSLGEIAKERGMTVGTIISHFEKLQEYKTQIDLEKFRPKRSDLERIKVAFAATKDAKLSPVHRKLKGKYTYEELRLARLFL